MPIRLLTSAEMQLVETVETNTATNALKLQPYTDSARVLDWRLFIIRSASRL